MRKQSLIHLHGLCAELRSHVEEHHDLHPEAFETYERVNVAPTAIHRRKDAHREAVTCLLDDLAAICRRSRTDERADARLSSRTGQ